MTPRGRSQDPDFYDRILREPSPLQKKRVQELLMNVTNLKGGKVLRPVSLRCTLHIF